MGLLSLISAYSPLEVLKALVISDGHAAREDLNRQRRIARRAPISNPRTQCPTRDDIRLPMCLALQACERVVHREQLERPDPRVLPRVICDKGRDETRLQSHFAARKALAAAPPKPLIGIIALIGPGAAEPVL